ncbi:unnamed protein product, partial [Rotaria sp. Silwood1]
TTTTRTTTTTTTTRTTTTTTTTRTTTTTTTTGRCDFCVLPDNNGNNAPNVTCTVYCSGAGRGGTDCTIITSSTDCPSGNGNDRSCISAPGFRCCC